MSLPQREVVAVNLLLAAAIALGACARAATGGNSPETGDPCFIGAGTVAPRDTVTLSFTEQIDPAGAPVPANTAERVLFRQTSETLTRLDCTGQIRPALARRWTRDHPSGFVWSFELDTTPALGKTIVPSHVVVATWEARKNGGMWPWPRILSVEAVAPFILQVRLDSVFTELPAAFASPDLSIPVGPFRQELSARPTAGPLVELIHLVPSTLPSIVPVIRFQFLHRGVDTRDMLDFPTVNLLRAADLVITREPEALSYARSKPGFRTVPLPWDRTYVLVTPISQSDTASGQNQSAFRQALAREAVRAEARAAEGPFWWETEAKCSGTMPLLPMGRLPQIVYPGDDPMARELAERLVALRFPTLRTSGLLPDPLMASLAGGEAVAYVIPLPLLTPASCRRLPRWPSAAAVVPLVDSRAHVIVRPGVPPFVIDGDAAIRFIPATP